VPVLYHGRMCTVTLHESKTGAELLSDARAALEAQESTHRPGAVTQEHSFSHILAS
jgi:hypothetical protein